MSFEYIYRKSPIFLQNIICSIYGIREKKIRFSSEFFFHLEQYKSTEFWSKDKIDEFKKNSINETIQQALENVPYYRNTLSKLRTKDVNYNNLNNMPLLSKEDIRNNLNSLLSNEYTSDILQEFHTSGATGKALIFYKSPKSIAKQWAIWYRHRARFDCELGDIHVNFTGQQVVPIGQTKPPYWRYNSPLKQYLINMQHVSSSKINDIVKFLNTIQPKFYSGYPSIIAEVARLAIEHELFLKEENKPEYIFCGAENTLDYQKAILEEWTGAVVTDQYGLTEGNCNMSKCEYGNYHEDFEFCHVECVDPEVLPDGRVRGRLIGTSFSNPAMPLIRYDTGDVAIWPNSDYKCPCGRNSTVIESIEGRVDDVIVLLDGRKIMRFDYLFKNTKSIYEAQVCQYKLGEVVIKIVPRKNYSNKTDLELKNDFSQWICADTKVIIEHVKSIEKSSRGKFKAVCSYLLDT